VELAEVSPGTRVLEVGAGLGSLTVELARAGAEVVAVEIDRRLLPALAEATAPYPSVRIEAVDATVARWGTLLDEPGPWRMVANLPYNVAVPVVMRALDTEPRIDRFVVMVQREVGERLAARPGDPQYGAVSVRVAFRADARAIRRVPAAVFWPRPNVESVLVSIIRRPPPVPVAEGVLWPVIEAAFEQRRKTIRNALLRLGLEPGQARDALAACGVDPSARPEQLGLEQFACLAAEWASLTRRS
jgi:16S rRNA (adenine1518-N6/adenine1519-N6)-dimethyltransferase